jgi:hypothetical protein
MLELALTRSVPHAPPHRLKADEVYVWRNNDGAPAAYGYTRNGTHWIEYPGVGTFRFTSGSEQIEALAVHTSLPRLRGTYRRCVLPLAIQALGKEVLHASGVITPKGAVALCGRSETGKSTLAYGLQQRGHQPFADDAVVVDLDGTRARVSGAPFVIRLRLDSAAHFERDPHHDDTFDEADLEFHDRAEPLAAVIALEQVTELAAPEVEIKRLTSPAAFPIVLTHAYCFSLREPRRTRLMMEHYLDLVSHTPVFRLRFSPGLERLHRMLDLIEGAIR